MFGDVAVVAVAVEHRNVEADCDGRDQRVGLRANSHSSPSELSVNRCGIEPVDFGGECFMVLRFQQPLYLDYSISTGTCQDLQQDRVDDDHLTVGDRSAHPVSFR